MLQYWNIKCSYVRYAIIFCLRQNGEYSKIRATQNFKLYVWVRLRVFIKEKHILERMS